MFVLRLLPTRPRLLLLLMGLCAHLFVPEYLPAARDFQELRGDHFIVYFQNDETYAREVSHRSERLYSSILRNLGRDQLGHPWLGERRCKITLFKDQATFQKRANDVQWAEGMANYQTREIFAFNGNPHLMSSVLPHEITHMLFREIMGRADGIPLWLDEGVALSQEDGKREDLLRVARKAFQEGTFLPFKEMAGIRDARGLNAGQAKIFYAQAMVTVNFLMDSFHQQKFLKFCRLIGEGAQAEDALKRVYGADRIQSLRDLQEHVRKHVR